MSGTDWEVFSGVWAWSVDPFSGLGWVGGGTLEGPGLNGGPPKGLRWVGRTLRISEMKGEILRKVWDG